MRSRRPTRARPGWWRPGVWLKAAAAAAFWYVAYAYLAVPDVRPLVATNPGTTAFMERRAREADTAAWRADQRWVPYARIATTLKRAVLVAEDAAFWQHDGVDMDAVREAIETNIERREFARGASTITQQLAKNLYLSPSKNPARKLRELMITRRLEAVLSKRRILEIYLNVIEWGDGIFGAEAAARTYFRKPASALSASEAAMLAGAIINPRRYSPAAPNARLYRRQRMILRRMGAATPPPDTAPAARAGDAVGPGAGAGAPPDGGERREDAPPSDGVPTGEPAQGTPALPSLPDETLPPPPGSGPPASATPTPEPATRPTPRPAPKPKPDGAAH